MTVHIARRTEVRRISPEGTVHLFGSVGAAFSACGRLPRSFAGPMVSVRREPLCLRCWPLPPPAVAVLRFVGRPVDLPPPPGIVARAG